MQKHMVMILFYFLPFLAFGKEQKSVDSTITFESVVALDSELGKGLVEAFNEIFQKQGLKFRAVNFPMQRGLEELKFGRVAGTVGRTGDIERNLGIKNVVRIDYPIASLTLSLWCHNEFRQRSQNLKLALALGTSMVNAITPYIDQKRISISPVQSSRNIVSMTKARRLDCMLSNDVHLEATGVALAELSGLQRIDVMIAQAFPWISVQYEHLKVAIEDGLRKHDFAASFRKKYQTPGPACQGHVNLLCPDGVVFKSPIDVSKDPSFSSMRP